MGGGPSEAVVYARTLGAILREIWVRFPAVSREDGRKKSPACKAGEPGAIPDLTLTHCVAPHCGIIASDTVGAPPRSCDLGI